MATDDIKTALADARDDTQHYTPETDEWVTVSEEEVDESKIVFDTIGDEFIGTYLGPRKVENENGTFTQYRFEYDGNVFFTNAGYSLMRAMANVNKGARVRVTYVSDRDTGQDSPMRIFRVDVAKRKSAQRK